MNQTPLNTTQLNAPGGAGSLTIRTAFDLVAAINRTIETGFDLCLIATYMVETGFDLVALGGSTKFASFDFIAATPFKNLGAFTRSIGDGLSIPIDPNKLSQWSTYTRPANPVMNQCGINRQTGKIEYWDGVRWKNYDNTNA